METEKSPESSPKKLLVVALGFSLGVILVMAYLVGWFSPKIRKGDEAQGERPVGSAQVVPVRLLDLTRSETAVGTLRPVSETAVASRIMARVLEVRVRAGQRVEKGQIVVQLSRIDLEAQVEQARAELAARQADRDLAASNLTRSTALKARQAVTQADFDRCSSQARNADAQLDRAKQALLEREEALSWATIAAPSAGRIVDKKVEAGDMVSPGQTLLTLYDPQRMQLVASVRETLASRIKVGDRTEILLDSAGLKCDGEVSEIVPESDAQSRSFSVKVVASCGDGVYAGTFGRLRIPLEERVAAVLIPRAAVQKVGQLDMVDVAVGGKRQRRLVQLGSDHADGDVEVLSGLKSGEAVVVDASAERHQ